MDIGIRSRLTSGFAVVSVGALVMTPVVAGQAAQTPTSAVPPAVMLAAATHSVPSPRIPMQPIALAPLQQAPPQLAPLQQAPRPMAAPRQQPAPLQQLNPIAQQVDFHIAFVADFLTTGAVLFGREFAIPGALLQDIHNGVPVPAAVGRALQTFVQIELEAGRELVGFAVEYVSFQLKFVANLVTLPIAAVGTLLSDLTPAPRHARPSPPSDSTTCRRQSGQHSSCRPQRQLPTKPRQGSPAPRRFSASVIRGPAPRRWRTPSPTNRRRSGQLSWNLSRLPVEQLRPMARTATLAHQTGPMSIRRP